MTSTSPPSTDKNLSDRYPPIPFHRILEEAADRFEDRVALLYEEQRISFR